MRDDAPTRVNRTQQRILSSGVIGSVIGNRNKHEPRPPTDLQPHRIADTRSHIDRKPRRPIFHLSQRLPRKIRPPRHRGQPHPVPNPPRPDNPRQRRPKRMQILRIRRLHHQQPHPRQHRQIAFAPLLPSLRHTSSRSLRLHAINTRFRPESFTPPEKRSEDRRVVAQSRVRHDTGR